MKSRRVSVVCFLIVVLVMVAIWAMPVAAQDRQTGVFTICKQTLPKGLDQSFWFEWGQAVPNKLEPSVPSFSLKGGQCKSFELPVGVEYHFVEDVPEGWDLRIECNLQEPATLGKLSGVVVIMGDEDGDCTFTNVAPPSGPPPFVPEASTFVLLGGAATTLAGYVSLQIRARRRK